MTHLKCNFSLLFVCVCFVLGQSLQRIATNLETWSTNAQAYGGKTTSDGALSRPSPGFPGPTATLYFLLVDSLPQAKTRSSSTGTPLSASREERMPPTGSMMYRFLIEPATMISEWVSRRLTRRRQWVRDLFVEE